MEPLIAKDHYNDFCYSKSALPSLCRDIWCFFSQETDQQWSLSQLSVHGPEPPHPGWPSTNQFYINYTTLSTLESSHPLIACHRLLHMGGLRCWCSSESYFSCLDLEAGNHSTVEWFCSILSSNSELETRDETKHMWLIKFLQLEPHLRWKWQIGWAVFKVALMLSPILQLLGCRVYTCMVICSCIQAFWYH